MTQTISALDAQFLLTQYIGRINEGTTNPTPRVLVYTTNYGLLLATFNLNASAFGAASLPSLTNDSIAIAATLPKTTITVAAGSIGSFQLINRNAVVKLQGTGQGSVSTSGAIVIVNKASVISGESLELTNLRLAMPTLLQLL